MKWFFCWCQDTEFRDDHNWKDLIRASLQSALMNTNLEPNFIYDGEPSEFTDELEGRGVNVIFHRLSFTKEIINFKPDDKGFQAVARGAFLRFDIPIVTTCNDNFVLYTDADVMFLKNPDFSGYNPGFIAATPESKRGNKEDFNSGVMLINLKTFRIIYNSLINFTVNNLDIASKFAFDQGILKEFLKQNYLLLPDIYNWKPYWGINSCAEIVHWHGPKPETIRRLLENEIQETHAGWMHLIKENEDYYRVYLNKYKLIMNNYYRNDKNISLNKFATQSSVSQWSGRSTPEADASGAVDGIIDGLQGFHTDIEEFPWWMVDLGGNYIISGICIYNRLDLAPAIPQRSSRLVIEIGPNIELFTEVYRRESDESFGGADGNPLVWMPSQPVMGRYVRIRLLTRNYLHLDQVEVFGKPVEELNHPLIFPA